MTRSYYHATPFENLDSILKSGIKRGCDGVVYLTTAPDEATRFLTIRGYKDILVAEVFLEEDLVTESSDHSEAFFKCKAYMYGEDIPAYEIMDYSRWTVGGDNNE